MCSIAWKSPIFESSKVANGMAGSFGPPSSPSRPQGLILPVFQDQYTLQFVTQLSQGTPKVTLNVVVDLGGKFLSVYSSQGCSSVSKKPIRCKSPQCSLARQSVDYVRCHSNTCDFYTTSPITHSATKSELFSGVVTVQSSEVREPISGAWIAGPNLTARGFAVSCGTTTSVLHGLAKGAKGLAGLGRSGLSLVSQFSAAFQIPEIFVLYLSRSENGFIYFGNETYLLQTPLFYTPLLVNPGFSRGSLAATDSDYFIDVKSIEIDGENVPINKELLSIDKKNGVGGTKLSTVVPFTVMETSIYKAFIGIYIKRAKAMNFLRVASVVPFSACFNASTMPTGVGALTFSIPKVDLVLPNKLRWQMTRPDNILVYLPGNLVVCLTFADGGAKPRTSIVIGGKQLLYTVLQFDIPRSRLGFSAGLQV
ncbi:basic 7S globulin 2-like [Papaver somniferum]|uniref:basic 7S globulin 2-like n=1 Tax=Papaver somniferum TaxID=3469 RepID=UPI000E6FDE4F|nr:basic 7S globulin 2-like [Papaver somniferum]